MLAPCGAAKTEAPVRGGPRLAAVEEAPVKPPPPAPAPPPVFGMFSSLDDVLKHVAEVKVYRKAKLTDSGKVLQRLLRVLREAGRRKAFGLAEIVATAVTDIVWCNSERDLEFQVSRSSFATSRVSTRSSNRAHFLKCVNEFVRPSSIDDTGAPLPSAQPPAFEDVPSVHSHVCDLRDARLSKLQWAHGVIVAGFRYHVSCRGQQGDAFARAALAILQAGVCTSTRLDTLARHVSRLACLQTVVPRTPLSLRPFAATIADILPGANDAAAAVAAGLYVAPKAVLVTVDDVVAYGDEVAAARRQHLEASQTRIRGGYLGFTDRMRRRAFALSEAAAARVLALARGRSQAALDRLVAAVAGLVRLVPSSSPAPKVFLESLRIELDGVVAVTAITDMDAVVAVATSERDKRLAVLRDKAAVMSSAYLAYRARMLLRGKGLAHVVVVVFTTVVNAHSDVQLTWLEDRLARSRARLPSLPDVQQAFLQVVGVGMGVRKGCMCVRGASMLLCVRFVRV